MDSVLSYVRSPDEDYYAILGCASDSTVEQIVAEYKVRARELHPDKNVEETSETTDKFQKLQVAKDILTDPERRADYDKWKNSGLLVSYKDWKALKGKTHAGMHWAPPRSFKPMLEDSETNADQPIPASAQAVNRPERERTNGTQAAFVPFTWTRDDRSRRFQNYEL